MLLDSFGNEMLPKFCNCVGGTWYATVVGEGICAPAKFHLFGHDHEGAEPNDEHQQLRKVPKK